MSFFDPKTDEQIKQMITDFQANIKKNFGKELKESEIAKELDLILGEKIKEFVHSTFADLSAGNLLSAIRIISAMQKTAPPDPVDEGLTTVEKVPPQVRGFFSGKSKK